MHAARDRRGGSTHTRRPRFTASFLPLRSTVADGAIAALSDTLFARYPICDG